MSAPEVKTIERYPVSHNPGLFKSEGSIVDWMNNAGINPTVKRRFNQSGTGVLNYCLDKILLWGGFNPEWDRFNIKGGQGSSVFISTPTFEIPEIESGQRESRLLIITAASANPRFSRNYSIAHIELVDDQADPSDVIQGTVLGWNPGTDNHPRSTLLLPSGHLKCLAPEPSTVISDPHTNYLIKATMAGHQALCPPESDVFKA